MGHREAGPGGVALGALDGDQLGFFVDGLFDAVVIKVPVGKQVYLPVVNAVLRQRAGAFPDADDLLQGVIGHAHGREQFVTGQQIGAEGDGQCMGAAGDLGPDQGGLRVEHIGVDLFQSIPAQVIVTVAGGGGKAGGGYPVFLHGGQNLGLIVLRHRVNGGKALTQPLQGLFTVGVDPGRNAHFHIHIYKFFQKIHAFFHFLHFEHYMKNTRKSQGISHKKTPQKVFCGEKAQSFLRFPRLPKRMMSRSSWARAVAVAAT